jgi:hypothetical protein
MFVWFRPSGRQNKKIEPHLTAAGANGFGRPFHLHFTLHELPDAGAGQISYDTLCLPKYSPIGNGPGNRKGFEYTARPLQPLHGVTLQAIGAPGVMAGGFYAGSLTNVTSPELGDETQAAYAGMRLAPGSYRL